MSFSLETYVETDLPSVSIASSIWHQATSHVVAAQSILRQILSSSSSSRRTSSEHKPYICNLQLCPHHLPLAATSGNEAAAPCLTASNPAQSSSSNIHLETHQVKRWPSHQPPTRDIASKYLKTHLSACRQASAQERGRTRLETQSSSPTMVKMLHSWIPASPAAPRSIARQLSRRATEGAAEQQALKVGMERLSRTTQKRPKTTTRRDSLMTLSERW